MYLIEESLAYRLTKAYLEVINDMALYFLRESVYSLDGIYIDFDLIRRKIGDKVESYSDMWFSEIDNYYHNQYRTDIKRAIDIYASTYNITKRD